MQPKTKTKATEQKQSKIAPRSKAQMYQAHTKSATILQPKFNRLKVKNQQNSSSLYQELKFLDGISCDIQRVHHLAYDLQINEFPEIVSPLLLKDDDKNKNVCGPLRGGHYPKDLFIFTNSFIISEKFFSSYNSLDDAKRYLRAGPRMHLFFNPNEVVAGIVTSYAISPGVNVIIREIANELYYNYSATQIYGAKYSFKGLLENEWVALNPGKINTIHNLGGSILGVQAGMQQLDFEPNISLIVDNLEKKKINQLYLIGNLFDHVVLEDIFREIKKRKLSIVVCGLIATPDKEYPIVDSTVGFYTAVEVSSRLVQSAYVDTHTSEYGVGLIKTIGKYSGFNAMATCLASLDVHICLVPEFKFEMDGPSGLLAYIFNRIKTKRRCILVYSEGAGYQILAKLFNFIGYAMLDKQMPDPGMDIYGNHKDPDFGAFLQDQISEYCSKYDLKVNILQIDTTHQARTAVANPLDKTKSAQVAQAAVHTLMAGFTGCFLGTQGSHTTVIPLKECLASSGNEVCIKPFSNQWQRLLQTTGQPSFRNAQQIKE